MTKMLFRDDAYMREAQAKVIGHTMEGGVVLDATVFYPKGAVSQETVDNCVGTLKPC